MRFYLLAFVLLIISSWLAAQSVDYYDENRLLDAIHRTTPHLGRWDSTRMVAQWQDSIQHFKRMFEDLAGICGASEGYIEKKGAQLLRMQGRIMTTDSLLQTLIPAYDSIASRITQHVIAELWTEQSLQLVPMSVVLYRDGKCRDQTELLIDACRAADWQKRVKSGYLFWQRRAFKILEK